MSEQKERKNPFFFPYNTPHDVAPFDCIRLEDYEEAFMEGIRREDEQIDKIVNDPRKPTFDNTIISIDDEKDGEGYYDLLGRVSSVFFNLLSAETNDDMDALAQKLSPVLTKHANDIRLNEKLFERIKYVHQHHRKLTPEEKMLLDKCYDGFVRSGALLDASGKERLRQLTEEASVLGLQFSQNLLKENKAFTLHITDESQLDGLPETAREAAALAAKELEKEGWVFTLDFPSYSPFMTYSTQRELRRQMYMAKNTECIHDNSENNLEICKRLINLRRELAQLLGHKTYADYVLKHRMAGNVRNVYKLLNDLITAYKPTAQKEVAAIEKMARKAEGKDFKLEPWDFGFYSHDELRRLMASADLCVHCATTEVEGLSVMEALQQGAVPVIATAKYSATPQFALDDRSTFPGRNPKVLAERIDYWLSHPDERWKMGKKYVESMKQYEISESAKQLIEMFEEAIKSKSSNLG